MKQNNQVVQPHAQKFHRKLTGKFCTSLITANILECGWLGFRYGTSNWKDTG